MREITHKNIIITSNQACAICTVLWILSHLAQWHNVLAFRTSKTSGTSRKHSWKHKHFRDDPLACWHTSGMMVHCWYSRLTYSTGKLMMIHYSLNLQTQMAHTDDVVSLQDAWWWCICWCRWCIFWVRTGSKPVHTQKLAHPHKLKINPNFEIWTHLNNLANFVNNFDNFVSFYDWTFSWHLSRTSMCNIWEPIRVKNCKNPT